MARGPVRGFACPDCGHSKTWVTAGNPATVLGESVRIRYRKCESCSHTFSTTEIVHRRGEMRTDAMRSMVVRREELDLILALADELRDALTQLGRGTVKDMAS
jgi:transcriptional regulator NrdR family protein